jgi:hypothetical protein
MAHWQSGVADGQQAAAADEDEQEGHPNCQKLIHDYRRVRVRVCVRVVRVCVCVCARACVMWC